MTLKNVHLIKSNESVEDIAYTFRQYGLVSAPVVSNENKILGIITVDDVVEIDHEELEDDIQKLGGLFVNDFYKGALNSASSRFIWLGLNLLTAILASLVIDIYSDQLTTNDSYSCFNANSCFYGWKCRNSGYDYICSCNSY